ncbi:MAG TPA: hypothetical protein VGI70_09540, partial [Polyangiales bacterium]
MTFETTPIPHGQRHASTARLRAAAVMIMVSIAGCSDPETHAETPEASVKTYFALFNSDFTGADALTTQDFDLVNPLGTLFSGQG